MNNQDFNADDLLKNINKSILATGIIVALIIHAVIVFGTSFGLYKDWSEYGIKKPSTIKQMKKEQQVAAEKERRDAEIKRKAEEAAITASNAVPVSAKAEQSAKQMETNGKPVASSDSTDGNVKIPEIEPLKPASTDDLSLDDMGL